MHSLIQLKRATSLFLIVLGFVWLGLLANAQAVSPAPDGGYPGGNTAEGQTALLSLTTGGFNTAVGFFSLRSNTTGSFNTAIGAGTLLVNTADQNTAIGAGALLSNTSGFANTANGTFALFSNTGSFNTASGAGALQLNTGGSNNTATGVDALFSNTMGNDNTAIGTRALFSSTGNASTAVGRDALTNNITGVNNTATGFQALASNIDGNGNTANGKSALSSNTSGLGNTALGFQALLNNTGGSANTAIGANAGSNVMTATGVICIGNIGADVGDTCFIGNIRGVTTQNGDALPVLIDSAGQLGTMSSSLRFKTRIEPMSETSESILALKPVTFQYKNDATGTPQFGLIAEEVAEVNPNLVVRDKNGEIYTVRYDAVNAMLLNEFLKEHCKVQEQEVTIAQLKKDFQATVAQFTQRLDEQASQIQKVSAQLEVSKPAPQVVNNP
jgi:hypothetical protein